MSNGISYSVRGISRIARRHVPHGEGSKGGFRVPSVSNDWLLGDWVLEHMPHALREDRLVTSTGR